MTNHGRDDSAADVIALARSVGLRGVRPKSAERAVGQDAGKAATAPLKSMDGAAELVALARAFGILPIAETGHQADA